MDWTVHQQLLNCINIGETGDFKIYEPLINFRKKDIIRERTGYCKYLELSAL